jgi:hypothetical protein
MVYEHMVDTSDQLQQYIFDAARQVKITLQIFVRLCAFC